VWEEQRVEIRYRKRDGEVKRLLDPLGLVLKAGVWYLVALSGRTRSLRTFRVSRVQSVRVLDEAAVRPDDFDLATHWAEASDEFLGSWQTTPVHVRVRAEHLRLVRYVQDPTRTEAALASASPPDDDGWVRVTLQFENLEMAGYDLMRLGGDVEVLEPVELRAHLATRASEMVERYSSVPA
jgi:predicted DNA-binding transcriptional regulator YafY